MVQEKESDEQKVDHDVMSEVRDELTCATNLTEYLEEVEETCIEVKRRTRTQERRQPERGQEESTDGSDLRQGERVEDVPPDGITKRQS